MSRAQERVVADQFGPRAGAYVSSAVHAGGPDLDRIEAVVVAYARERAGGEAPTGGLKALDLGCGGGHVSYRVAPSVAEVTALDLSTQMLTAVQAEAERRGLANIRTVEGAAERLTFEDCAFDLVFSRFSAHHWRDLDAGLREARRVLKSGGVAVFVDVTSPGQSLLDTHLQAVELLRDPSHVRDYSAAEWLDASRRAGFAFGAMTQHRLRLEFASWVERMRTPTLQVQAIRALQHQAAEEVRTCFEILSDGSFAVDVTVLELSKR